MWMMPLHLNDDDDDDEQAIFGILKQGQLLKKSSAANFWRHFKG